MMKEKLLLDTHTLIWMDIESSKLSSRVAILLQDKSNTLLLSVVSVWEMQIKHQLGKLKLNQPLVEMIKSQQQINNIEILPVTLAHVFALQNLPTPHKDPFDRLLVAQAIVEKAALISNDAVLAKYPVNVLW
ncbi:MAG: type II toxin-antitoxin system VapC family toxin [Pseudomonadota bacterium]